MIRFLFVIFIVMSSVNSMASTHALIYQPSFWISQLDNPDAVLMDKEEIVQFNDSVIALTEQMAGLEKMDKMIEGSRIKDYLVHDPLPYNQKRFGRNSIKISQRFLRQLEKNMNIDAVPAAVETRFAVIIKASDIRAFPTIEPIYEYPNSKDFDTVQYSKIYPPEPVVLLYVSRDKKWGFFQTGFVRGWLRLADVAFAKDRADVFFEDRDFLVVIGSFVDVYKDKGFKYALERLPMGTRLSISGEDDKRWVVSFPFRLSDGSLKWQHAYINKGADVNKGFLPYTKRNIVQQSFKLVGEGYGWGNINGKRDCSSFIKDVFAAVGIYLPRNSKQQILTGSIIGHKDNGNSYNEMREIVKKAVPGITLLGINGHIMLYLGRFNEQDYVIHSLFGYKEMSGFKTVNSIIVTDLNLGGTIKNGAFIDRLKGITLVINDPQTKNLAR